MGRKGFQMDSKYNYLMDSPVFMIGVTVVGFALWLCVSFALLS
jgi:hypothetical protein